MDKNSSVFYWLKEAIIKDLNNCSIESLDEYIYELHEILPNHIKQVPEQSSYEFYEFAAKFLQYLIDENYNCIKKIDESVYDVFIVCPTEICEVTNALSSQSGEDITSDIIKIISTAKSLNIVNNEEEAQIFLDSIFTITNHDWTDMDNQWIHCNWNQVMLMNNLDEEIIEDNEDPEFNDYVSINSYDDGMIFYDDESIAELEADGIITDWYQGPGTYDTYDNFKPVDLVSDFPNKDDSVQDNVVYDLITELEEQYPNHIITYDELLDAYNDSGIYHLISMFNVAEILDGQGWTIIEIPDSSETFKERFEDNDVFMPTGYKTSYSMGGKEIEISNDGSMARIKFENDSISEWLTIQYTDDSRAYVDIYEFNTKAAGNEYNFEFLDEYMKY